MANYCQDFEHRGDFEVKRDGLVGKSLKTYDKGKIRNWGIIKGIASNKDYVIYLSSNPVGYKWRTEDIKSVMDWIKKGLIKEKATN